MNFRFLFFAAVLLGVLVTWVGLALAYFFGYPVGFYISTAAFVPYAVARLVRVVLDRR